MSLFFALLNSWVAMKELVLQTKKTLMSNDMAL